MNTYRPPLRRIAHVIHDVLGAEHVLSGLPLYAGVDRALIDEIVVEAGNFAARLLMPTRIPSDAGYRFEGGRVYAPPGYAEVYRAFVDAGWPSLACEQEDGGQGLPMLLHNVMLELLNSANPAWSMFPGIAHGAYDCLRAHASEALKAAYLKKIASGEWTASMCLTEAQAGSDLGLVRSRAEPEGNAYRVTGTKIFISGGDHDVAENIVHLVLARLPGAPDGTRGLSLFVVPHRLPLDDGLEDGLNGITVVSLEHKMGIRGSATCALAFEGARGWLVGQPHRGLQCMFVMMNAARLGVGMQSVGASELAYQLSAEYARTRLQGRVGHSEQTQSLSAHADVRRMLLTQKAWTDGARLMSYWLSLQLDIERAHPDEKARIAASQLLSLATPVAKAFLSDNAYSVANLAIQIYGGHGYMVEHGIEQIVRDVRVFSIYEGTNGIQALDLLQRKVQADGGQRFVTLLDQIDLRLTDLPARAADCGTRLAVLLSDVRDTLNLIPASEESGGVASHFLRAVGHVLMGWRFVEALCATPSDQDVDRSFDVTARFYFDQLFPEAATCLHVVRYGASAPMANEAALFDVY
jgi:alkylation response protein AidB-like acyl-CoA dehydrogenase